MRRHLLAAALALVIAAPATAQTPPDPSAPGRLNAFLYREVPAGGAFKVAPLDDSRDNRRLAQAFERALERAGRKLDRNAAPLALSFTTEIAQVGRPGPQGTLGIVEASRDDARVRLNLFSNNEDSLAGGARRADGATASVRYTLIATVEDTRGGRLWQGTATLLGTPGDEQAAFAAMARAIAEEIGKTVRQRPFRIE
jgi:acyl transferase domain-containing protein